MGGVRTVQRDRYTEVAGYLFSVVVVEGEFVGYSRWANLESFSFSGLGS
jgi:hypothetical protein